MIPTLTLLVGCTDRTPTPEQVGVAAIVDEGRAEHWLDLPFPTDEAAIDGHANLTSFPLDSATPLVSSWAYDVSTAASGYAVNGPFYFRFEGGISVPATTEGAAADVVQLIDTTTSQRLPLRLTFVDDPAGDPWLAPNTLIGAPKRSPTSGATLLAVVLTSAGATRAPGWSPTASMEQHLRGAGLNPDDVAVATSWTVQDPVRDLLAVQSAVDRYYDLHGWAPTGMSRVTRVSYTPVAGGVEQTLHLENGSTPTTLLPAVVATQGRSVNLDGDWPMVVYYGRLTAPYFQGLRDRPFTDDGGRLDLDTTGLHNDAEDNELRVIVSLPRDRDGDPRRDVPLVVWAHGSPGSAVDAVVRPSAADDTLSLNQAVADAGWGILSYDLPLHASRSSAPSDEEAFFNLVNAPALRDNLRQASADGFAVRRFIVDGALNEALPTGSVSTTTARLLGYDLGAVSSLLTAAASPSSWSSALWVGLDAPLPGPLTGSPGLPGVEVAVQSALRGQSFADTLGVPGPLQPTHPAAMLLGWLLDPADPLSFASRVDLPVTLLGQRDDAVEASLTNATALPCAALTDCLFSEWGADVVAQWLETP